MEQDFIFWEESARQGRVVRQDGFWCNEHASGLMLAPDEAHEAFFLANMAVDQLKSLAESKQGNPFHLRVDFWGPHQPYFPTKRFADMYSENDIELPLSFYEDVANNAKPPVYATEFNKGISRDGKLVYPNPLDKTVWKRVLARAYAQITLVDAAAGLVLDALDALGLAGDTLVIMTTDHGDGLACHGGHFDKGSYLCEEVLRVPLAARCPGRLPANEKCEALTSNLDVAPTILDAAGLDGPCTSAMDGYSLFKIAGGEVQRDYFVCENHGHFDKNIGRAFIAGGLGGWKYVYNSGQMDELYNLAHDPDELYNLAKHPEHRHRRDEMRQALIRWAEETADTAFLEALRADTEEMAHEQSNP